MLPLSDNDAELQRVTDSVGDVVTDTEVVWLGDAVPETLTQLEGDGVEHGDIEALADWEELVVLLGEDVSDTDAEGQPLTVPDVVPQRLAVEQTDAVPEAHSDGEDETLAHSEAEALPHTERLSDAHPLGVPEPHTVCDSDGVALKLRETVPLRHALAESELLAQPLGDGERVLVPDTELLPVPDPLTEEQTVADGDPVVEVLKDGVGDKEADEQGLAVEQPDTVALALRLVDTDSDGLPQEVGEGDADTVRDALELSLGVALDERVAQPLDGDDDGHGLTLPLLLKDRESVLLRVPDCVGDAVAEAEVLWLGESALDSLPQPEGDAVEQNDAEVLPETVTVREPLGDDEPERDMDDEAVSEGDAELQRLVVAHCEAVSETLADLLVDVHTVVVALWEAQALTEVVADCILEPDVDTVTLRD